MNSDNDGRSRRAGREAAERYVELDAHPGERKREDALIEWLEGSPEHEAAFERCEAAVALAQELALRDGWRSESESESESSSRSRSRSRSRRRSGSESGSESESESGSGSGSGSGSAANADSSGARRVAGWLSSLYRRPALAWSVAGAAVLVAALDLPSGVRIEPEATQALALAEPEAEPVLPAESGLQIETGRPAVAAARSGAAEAIDDRSSGVAGSTRRGATLVSAVPLDGAPMIESQNDLFEANTFVSVDRAAVLPGDVIVDVHSLAVLPFDGSGDERQDASAAQRIAADLYNQVLRQLAQIPGIYVVDHMSSAAYDGAGLVASDVAAYLGVRGVVEGALTFEDGRIHARLRVTDAAAAERSFERAFDGPLSELQVMRLDIVTSIVTAIASVPIDYSDGY